jgi:hypothetical protein
LAASLEVVLVDWRKRLRVILEDAGSKIVFVGLYWAILALAKQIEKQNLMFSKMGHDFPWKPKSAF